MIGAPEAAANLLWELRIAPKKDAKEINNKNGKVIRVNVIAISIFSMSPTKPGAIRDTNAGINNWMISINDNKLKNKRLKTSFANKLDFFLLLIISEA